MLQVPKESFWLSTATGTWKTFMRMISKNTEQGRKEYSQQECIIININIWV